MNIQMHQQMSLLSISCSSNVAPGLFITFEVETRPLLFTKAGDSVLKQFIFTQYVIKHTVCVAAAEELFTERLSLTVSQLCSQVLGDE